MLNLDFFRIGFDIFGPRVVHLEVSNFQRFNPDLFGAQSKLEHMFSQAFLEELHPHSGEPLDSRFVKIQIEADGLVDNVICSVDVFHVEFNFW